MPKRSPGQQGRAVAPRSGPAAHPSGAARRTRATPDSANPISPAAAVASPPAGTHPQPDTPTSLLGGLTPAQFMRRYWQKKPLLIRQAIPDIAAPLSRDELFALADSDDAEARLVTHFRGRWGLEHGPFSPEQLPSPRQRAWTLLVQGVDLHDERARALLNQFRFVPDARLDDLMISYATDGGGVGPHFDSYDVFLLQVHGRRRWRIGAQRDLMLREDLPLKVLAHFEPDEEWVLEPGDMLYLPPHVAHDGIAVGECMTCSIGFRAPSASELTRQFLYYLAERGLAGAAGADTPYRDPRQPAVDRPAQLPPALVDQIATLVAKVRWRDEDIAAFAGTWLSEPKANVVFDPPARALDEARFAARAAQAGLRIDRRTILLYDARHYYLNGEQHRLADAGKWLRKFADERVLSGKRFVTLSRQPPVTALLHEWYRAGWIRLGERA